MKMNLLPMNIAKNITFPLWRSKAKKLEIELKQVQAQEQVGNIKVHVVDWQLNFYVTFQHFCEDTELL